MEVNSVYHGFILEKVIDVDQLEAKAFYFTHQKTKAKLFYLEREDENKTFSISFKTTPTDSTGVFHILEHCVLNGSEKYPLKEPFVDLLKSSLQTFLNAMTYPDKTVFPVSSRNEKDFLNLLSVYLDGVLNPNCKKNPFIFYQEGWHYKLDNIEDDIEYNGVVYSEMQGAFSNAERLADEHLLSMLYPDNCYRRCSGGNPEFIPDLTYENFCKTHDKYYHPSNSQIFLDGKMDLDKVLSLINSYFSNFTYNNEQITIDYQKPVIKEKEVRYYQPTDGLLDKRTIINIGYVICNYDDYQKILAFNVLAKVLADSNESILAKRLLEKQLCEDINVTLVDEILQPYFNITIVNCDSKDYDEIISIINETLEEIVKEGIDKAQVSSIISHMKFIDKEKDFQQTPAGVVYALSSYNSSNYGGDPLDSLVFGDLFDKLTSDLENGYFEKLIDELLLNSKHYSSIILEPTENYNQQIEEKTKEKLAKYKASLTEKELEQLVNTNKEFNTWQNTSDSKEAKDSLPKLQLSDIDEKAQHIDYSLKKYGNINCLSYPTNKDISYVNEIYQINDLTDEEYVLLHILSLIIGELDCKDLPLNQFLTDKYAYLGSFDIGLVVYENHQSNDYNSVLNVNYSFLDTNKDKALKLINQLLNHTLFEDKKAINDIISQTKTQIQRSIISSGHVYALKRARAALTEAAVINDLTTGYGFYKALQQLMLLDEDLIISKLKALYNKIFDVDRLTLAIASEKEEDIVNDIVSFRYSKKQIGDKVTRKPLSIEKEAIAVKSHVSFAVKAGKVNELIKENYGQMAVISKIISLDYLWNEIRAKAGAYGCGLSFNRKMYSFYSYRDPNPLNSYNIYNDCANYLQSFMDSKYPLDDFIIGTIGSSEAILTVRSNMELGNSEYFTGIGYTEKCKVRKQILSTNENDISKAIEFFKNNDSYKEVLVASRETIDKIGDFKIINEI